MLCHSLIIHEVFICYIVTFFRFNSGSDLKQVISCSNIVKMVDHSYLWILKRKKMTYVRKLPVASSETFQASHVIFLPKPLNADNVSQPVIASQNSKALHISSSKHFAYSCICSYLWRTSYSTLTLRSLRTLTLRS